MNRTRMTFATLILAAGLGIACAGTASAEGGFAKIGISSWERMMRDARAEALGGALQPLATGPFAILETAAPLSGRNSIEVGYDRFLGIVDDMTFQQLGLAGQWNHLRIGLLVASYDVDFDIRTAYNPEGTGSTLDIDNDFVMANVAWKLPFFGLDRSRAWSWTAGATWRRHSASIGESAWTGWDTDLGLTGRWMHPLPDGWLRVAGTALLRNPFEQEMDFYDREAELPRYRNLGLALSLVQDIFRNGRNDLIVSVGVSTIRDYMYDQSYFGDLRTGIEIELAGLVSVRAGSDERRAYAGEQSWGAGLALPAWISERFLLRYDYAHLSDTEDWEGGDRHTFTAGWAF